jgi:hypothetical protein
MLGILSDRLGSNAASSYLLQRRYDAGAVEDGWIIFEGGLTSPRWRL